MCISYNRLLSISTDITNSVIERYDRDGIVCPSKLQDDIFRTTAIDNIDHNPSSTSSHDSFHGTAISLAQHPTTEKLETDRTPMCSIVVKAQHRRKLRHCRPIKLRYHCWLFLPRPLLFPTLVLAWHLHRIVMRPPTTVIAKMIGWITQNKFVMRGS